MARVTLQTYSFNPMARTVTLTELATVDKTKIVSIRNKRTTETYYLADDAAKVTLSGKTLTLPVGVIITPALSTDPLAIVYDDAFVGETNVPGAGQGTGVSGGPYVPVNTAVTADGPAPGYVMKVDHNYFDNGTGSEPVIFNGYRTGGVGTAKRAFWLNENCSPRGASVNDEPALKLFGPASVTTYTGLLIQLLNRWNGTSSQQHVWGVGMDGNPRIGTGITLGANVIVLSAAATVPAGLPVGTVIIRTP